MPPIVGNIPIHFSSFFIVILIIFPKNNQLVFLVFESKYQYLTVWGSKQHLCIRVSHKKNHSISVSLWIFWAAAAALEYKIY